MPLHLKKLFLFLIFFGIFSPAFIFAQIAKNERIEAYTKTSDSTSKRTGDDIFNNIKIGIILPQGQFAQPITNPGGSVYDFTGLSKPFKGMDGVGAKPGINLQYEGFSSVWRIHSSGAMVAHFGLQYGFDFGYIPLKWNNVPWGNYDMVVGTSPFIFTGLKLGPALYFNPVKDMGIGIFALLDGFVNAPGGENASYSATNAAGTSIVAIYDIKDSDNVHLDLETSAGINIYYKAIVIGVEYDWFHTQYFGSVQETYTEVRSNGAITSPSTEYPFSSVLRINLIKFTFGVRLGYGRKSSRDKFD